VAGVPVGDERVGRRTRRGAPRDDDGERGHQVSVDARRVRIASDRTRCRPRRADCPHGIRTRNSRPRPRRRRT
jgi:hypothetical protein